MCNALEPKGEKRAVFPTQERAPIDSFHHVYIRQALMANKIHRISYSLYQFT